MRKLLPILVMTLAASTPVAAAQSAQMNFFLTSAGSGDGANLGGLQGADQICQDRAYAVGAGDLIWRAYLSTTGDSGENARDRIGDGPWYNYAGTMVARDVGDLHSESNLLGKENSLTERGEQVNGRGDSPNMHDIITGSTMDGMASDSDGDTTCENWTSNGSDGSALVGHHDRVGGGQNPTSWNSAHASRGCGQEDLQGTGGNGFFYCFGIGN
ncbi:MAG: hypothetical protein OXH08_00765 [Gammaproteobacteria bacterium]|nr:hypothetical protein [Gammaproteobacteria bacterium]MXW09202.1 hypothetical protein [Gammaproteobacteria bacterium]MYC53379.1 hypothetical protein [Gammaproteobacteria bacterium]